MLSDTDRISFQDKFSRDYTLLSQQMVSRLRPYTDDQPDAVDARYFWFNYIGKVEPRQKMGFAGPTPNMGPQHTRVRGNVVPYEWGDSFDEAQLRVLVADPRNKHKQAAMAGFARTEDRTIINAALGVRVQYNADGTTTDVPLPAGQVIASGATDLTFEKVRLAKGLFDAAEVDSGVANPRRVFVTNSHGLNNLLLDPKVTSRDFVTVQALIDGTITHWMGFDWVSTELLPVLGNGDRRNFAMAQNAVGTFMENTPRVNIGKDVANSFVERIMLDQNLGASRLEDVRIVEVDVDEIP